MSGFARLLKKQSLKILEIKIRKGAVHLLNSYKLLQTANQITHTHAAFFHELGLSGGAPQIAVAIDGITVIKCCGVDSAAGTANTHSGVTVVFRGEIFITFVVSASHTQIEVFTLCVAERAVEAKLYHVAVCPVGNGKILVGVSAVFGGFLLVNAVVPIQRTDFNGKVLAVCKQVKCGSGCGDCRGRCSGDRDRRSGL